MIVRLAFHLLFTRDPEHRWRRIMVPLAAAVLALLTLGTVALVQMVKHQEARVNDRMMPVAISDEQPSDLLVVQGADVVGDETIPVYWMQAADPRVDPALPPGISILVDYPTVYVSPEADRLLGGDLATHSSLPDRVQIGAAGLLSFDETFMYRPVPPGTDLSQHPFVTRVRAADSVTNQSGPMMRFGEELGRGFAVSQSNLLPAAITLLIIPAAVLMIVAVGAASGVRDHRFSVLRALGAPRSALVLLSACEVTFLAIPGVAAGVAGWWLSFQVIFNNRQSLPFVDHRPLMGDLLVPTSQVVQMVVALMLVAPLTAAVGAWVRYGQPVQTVRPVETSMKASPWRVAPVGFLAFGIAARIVIGQDQGAFLFLFSAIAMLATLPILLPGVIRPVGALLRRIPTVSALLAGRGIEWDTVRSARPVLSIGILVAVALGVSGMQAIVTSSDDSLDPAGSADVPAVLVNFWSNDQTADYAAMTGALPEQLVVRASPPEESIKLVATCPQLQPYFPGVACDADHPLSVPEAMNQSLGQSLNNGFPVPVEFVDESQLETKSFLAVIGTGEYESLLQSVRQAARQHLLWNNITLYGARIEQPGGAAAAWLVVGLQIAIIVLAAGAIVAAVDRFLGLQKHRSQLLHIGLLPRQLGQIDALQFLVVVLTAITLGAGLGILTVTQFLAESPETPVPWGEMRAIIQLALLGAVVGTLLVLVFEVRRFSRDDRRR